MKQFNKYKQNRKNRKIVSFFEMTSIYGIDLFLISVRVECTPHANVNCQAKNEHPAELLKEVVIFNEASNQKSG
jgi:hypothetical protein